MLVPIEQNLVRKQPNIDPLDLGPLTQTEIHSTRYIAREIRAGKASDINPKTFQTNIREPMAYPMYKRTLEAYSTIYVLLPISSTKFLAHNMVVQYRLLETRCQSSVSFDKMKKYNSSLHELRAAIKEWNSESRLIKKRSTTKNSNEDVNKNEKNKNDDSATDDNDSIDNEDSYIDFNNDNVMIPPGSNENEIIPPRNDNEFHMEINGTTNSEIIEKN